MTRQEQEGFREYVREISDELLEAVTADYLWLAAQTEDEGVQSRFHWRRRACREECVRRGNLRIWARAEAAIAGPVSSAA